MQLPYKLLSIRTGVGVHGINIELLDEHEVHRMNIRNRECLPVHFLIKTEATL